MAVKVISDAPVTTIKIICKQCMYELEYTGEDINMRDDGDGCYWGIVKCPRISCNYENKVKLIV